MGVVRQGRDRCCGAVTDRRWDLSEGWEIRQAREDAGALLSTASLPGWKKITCHVTSSTLNLDV